MFFSNKNKLKIKLKSNHELLYRKSNRSAHIECQLLYPANDSHGIAIYISTLKCWDDGSTIDENEIREIVEELKKDFLKHDYQVFIE